MGLGRSHYCRKLFYIQTHVFIWNESPKQVKQRFTAIENHNTIEKRNEEGERIWVKSGQD